jgi:hypothetical protein
MTSENEADQISRRADATQKFYEEATGVPHVVIAMMGHPDWKPDRENNECVAKRAVDAAQAMPGDTVTLKGRTMAEPPGYFVCVLFKRARRAIVYFTADNDDAKAVKAGYDAEIAKTHDPAPRPS